MLFNIVVLIIFKSIFYLKYIKLIFFILNQ